MDPTYETVIGLEVHAQLLTRTKTFCGCSTSFGDPPNTHTCPVCLGLPGALPVLNADAVRMATLAALALSCEVQDRSVFARKNYFYPDLPKGYQISQFDLPLAMRGGLDIETETGKKRIGILRVHMEEDAGKNLHGHGSDSIVDLNRAGTPLIEIVGDPDLRSAAEAAEYLKRLREVLMFLGVNDGNLEQGSFRCDANVSVRKAGEAKLGTRTELKNINSFRFVAEAIEIEARRQIGLLERGERVRQQTRGYNADKKETYLLRDKENESGYRYFPEPDLPPLVLDPAFVSELVAAVPPSPAAQRRRMVDELGLTPYAAGVLTSHPRIAAFFDEATRLHPQAVKIANFIQSEVLRDAKQAGLTLELPVSPAQVAELLRLVDGGAISGKQAKEVYAAMRGTTSDPATVVRDRGMAVMNDEGPIEELARKLVSENPKQASGYRAGKANLLGYFVGQIMKQTGGRADPVVVNSVLKRILDGDAVSTAIDPGPVGQRVPDVFEADAVTQRRPRPAEAGRAPVAPEAPAAGGKSPLAESVAPEPTTLTSGEKLAALLRPLGGSRGAAEGVSFEAFARVELRVGLVTAATPASADLLELTVDVADGGGPRKIISDLHAPESLVGLRVIVATNVHLEPRGDGLTSEGVLLTAGAAPITVPQEVPLGTRVK